MRQELVRFIASETGEFLRYLKSRYLVFHASNIFFRDIHYAVMGFLQERRTRCSYAEAETLARAVVRELESRGILRSIDSRTWMVNYPEFRKPSTVPAPVAKPAAEAPRPAVQAS